jgi:hypothetical protein
MEDRVKIKTNKKPKQQQQKKNKAMTVKWGVLGSWKGKERRGGDKRVIEGEYNMTTGMSWGSPLLCRINTTLIK